MEEISNNIRIAKFMGIDIVKRNNEDAVYMSENAAFPEYFRCTLHNTYHTDWNNLMSAIQKIHTIVHGDPTISIQRGRVGVWYYFLDGTERFNAFYPDKEGSVISCAYKAVGQFLDWYEQNSKLANTQHGKETR